MSETSGVSQKLSMMMFLEFFIWGSWYVTVGNYITAQGWENAGATIGNVYTLMPIAALLSPVLVGLIADRFFATEKVLAFLTSSFSSLDRSERPLSKSDPESTSPWICWNIEPS